ncbi:MAG: tRNA (adenosine(37)-N6)-dimethylallyltransferase MiaA [Oligosphaeraceae bacterium]
MTETLVILGPTCSGKSAVAARLAAKLGGEVVSFDSMQVYENLPVGTAQPGPEELSLAPHHLVGFLPLREPWNVNRFLPMVQEVVRQIRERGRVPVLAGGTGLYARALVYGFSLMPGDPALALRLREEASAPGGLEALRQELRQAGEPPRDLLQNPRHLLRAVEVLRLTGRAPWELKERTQNPREGFRQFCLLPEFSALKERIRKRTALMLRQGWIEECRAALAAGLAQAPTAWQALGYREIAAWLQGELPGTREELQTLLANRTIQYARKQLTWLRHQHPGAIPLPFSQFTDETPDRLTREILDTLPSCP